MKVFEFGNEQSDLILIQMVDSHSIKMLDSEMDQIRKLSGKDDFRLIACQVEDWNRDLSPWEAPPVLGKEEFGGRAEETLQELKETVLSRFGPTDRTTVGDSIRRLHQIYERIEDIETILEWNEGNHFREPELRMAKGFAWVMSGKDFRQESIDA